MTQAIVLATLQRTFEQALQFHAVGRLVDAEKAYRFVLAQAPRHAASLSNLALIVLANGNNGDGAAMLRRSLEIDPNQDAAWNNLALVLANSKLHEEAITCFDRSLDLQPGNAETLFGRAASKLALSRTEEAIVDLQAAEAANPSFLHAKVSLGEALAQESRWQEALDAFQRALALHNPNGASPDVTKLMGKACSDSGVCYERLGHLDLAVLAYQKAAAIDLLNLDALDRRAHLLRHLGRKEELATTLEEWEKRAAKDPAIQTFKGFGRLQEGDFEAGWALHEARLDVPELETDHGRAFGTSEIDINSDIANKVVLVYPEQGLGDTLQFYPLAVHFALRTRDANTKIILEVQKGLGCVLEPLKRPDNLFITERQTLMPVHDVHVALMSLPFHLGLRLQHLPLLRNYIAAPADAAAKWADKLPKLNTGQRRAGIVWAGSAGHKLDPYRSISFAEAQPLLRDTPMWQWHSLQKEVRRRDEALLADSVTMGQLHDHAAALGTFADTAALIAQLDLVVAVDTSVAHLAAAMGKPTWVLIAWQHDYRWMHDRTDSPWYPSMRLWRQAPGEAWGVVLERVRAALDEWR